MLVLGIGHDVHAEPPGPEAPPVAENGSRGRSFLQSASNKLRPGAALRAEAPPWPVVVELRSALGKSRDEAVSRHYTRIAELDFLADGANKEHDLRLAERIEMVRRRQTQQYFLQMQALKVETLQAWEKRLP